jgi:putative salt-induced outer membrane protein
MKKIILTILLASSLVFAVDEDKNKLLTHTEFGYVNTQGNSNTNAFSLETKVKKSFNKHTFILFFDGKYTTDDNVESKNKYLVELNYDYEFTEILAFDYLLGFKQDKFSGYEYQSYTGPGVKYQVIKTKKHNLEVEGHILYSQDETEDIKYDASGNVIKYPNANNIPTATRVNGKTKNYSSYRAKGIYTWQIIQNLKFTQELSYRSEFEDSTNYFVFSKTAFVNKISGMFSAGVNYKVDYANLAGDSKERADRTFTASLIIDF